MSRARPILSKVFLLLYVAALAAGLAVALWPEPAPSPLIGQDGWENTAGFFRNIVPNPLEVRAEITGHPATAFWRSWSPETEATAGTIRTRPFQAPPYLLVPYYGLPDREGGPRIFLERLADGERMTLADSRTNVQWAERLVRLDGSWRGQMVRLVASTGQGRGLLAVGPPFSASLISYLKRSGPALVFYHFLIFVVLVGPVAAGLMVFGPGRDVLGLALGLSLLGGLGLLLFFLFYFNNGVGLVFAALFIVGSSVAVCLGGAAASAETRDRLAGLIRPWFWGSLAYALFLYAGETGAGSWQANNLFYPMRWSSDNQLPVLVAEKLFQGGSLLGAVWPWQVSDRPPLLAGLLAPARVLFSVFHWSGTALPNVALWYHIGGIIANSVWIPVCLAGFRRLGLVRRQALLGVVLMGLSPFALFNTVYIWPKMLAGAFGLLAFFLVYPMVPGRAGESASADLPTLILAGALLGAALMSHGGAFFGLPVFVAWLLWRRILPLRPVPLLGFGLGAAALVLPWLVWQKLVDPPGDSLIKYALAGLPLAQAQEVTLLAAARKSLAGLTLGSWLAMKWRALWELAGWPMPICGRSEFGPMATAWWSAGFHRAKDFLVVLPSFNAFWLAAPAGLMCLRPAPPGAGALLGLGLASLVLTNLALWECHILHHQPYQAILMILLGLTAWLLALSARPRRLVIFLIAGYALAVWIVPPLASSLEINWGAAAGLAFLAGYFLYQFNSKVRS